MKKVSIILSVVFFAATFSSTYASNYCKKSHKKCKRYVCARLQKDLKDEVPKEKSAVVETKNDFFSNLSGSMAFTTNYVFRGLSQTENLPAVQGGLTYTFPIGLYLNMWGSNVKFPNTTATIEIDTIAGIHRTVGENFTYDINLARYNYNGASALSYNELNGVFNYYFVQAGFGYSSNVYNAHTSGLYLNGGVNYEIPQKFAFNLQNVTLLALIGRYQLGDNAGPSYTDYNVALNKKLSDIYSIGIQWVSTNGQAQYRPYDRDLFVGTVTATF